VIKDGLTDFRFSVTTVAFPFLVVTVMIPSSNLITYQSLISVGNSSIGENCIVFSLDLRRPIEQLCSFHPDLNCFLEDSFVKSMVPGISFIQQASPIGSLLFFLGSQLASNDRAKERLRITRIVRFRIDFIFLAERPSIANPYGRAMVNEGVMVELS
jgi:hypothetical protein